MKSTETKQLLQLCNSTLEEKVNWRIELQTHQTGLFRLDAVLQPAAAGVPHKPPFYMNCDK